MPTPSPPQLIDSPRAMRQIVRDLQRSGRTVGVVPTMGALHEGHLSLARRSKDRCDITVATIFVNPTQFGPNEDFSRYPRTLDEDLKLLASIGTQYVFCPAREAMYPEGFSTYVDPPSAAARLEGEMRPGHFRGVCTVVLKLFQAVPADVAFFGQKDFQQALVIEQMTRDLDLFPQIEVCPIVRAQDGLALSSRNRYLSPAERARALGLSLALRTVKDSVERGERDATALRESMRQILTKQGVDSIDYVSIADRRTLAELDRIADGAVALIAARVGSTRLIDNEILSVKD